MKLFRNTLFFLPIYLIITSTAQGQIFDGTNLSSDKPFFKVESFEYGPSEFYFIAFSSSPEIIRELVPEPLEPVDDVIQLFFCKYHLISPFKLDYQEAYMLIPVTFGSFSGGFIPILYLDEVEGIIPGREIAGFNKVGGEFNFEEDGRNISITVSQSDTVIIKAELRMGIRLPPGNKRENEFSVNHKYIPSPVMNANAEVNQLVSFKYIDKGRKNLKLAKAELDFYSTLFNPLDQIPIVEVKRAGYVVATFALGEGEILHDYLEEE